MRERAVATPEVSVRMSRQRRKDTSPELEVRGALRSLGHSYRVSVRGLPGSPDIANKKRGWAIFVHGCFWHHHPGCRHATLPKKNREWWRDKFERNSARDARKLEELRALGFDVLVIWECETRDTCLLRRKLEDWRR